MICFPNAKINIGLNVISKRPDGFHNIETIFYPIQLSDALEFIESSDSNTSIESIGAELNIESEQNICIKAYRLLADKYALPNIEIFLYKHIPSGAGLGGGSSDAAFMLKEINSHFKIGLSIFELQNYAIQLGSDCAFFVNNKPVYAFGRGEIFKPVQIDLSQYYIYLVKPNIFVSTSDAYKSVRLEKPEESLDKLIKQPIQEWKTLIFNQFENNIFKIHPELAKIKAKLYQAGALYASMSGSGSSIYGIFKEEPQLLSNFKDSFNWISRLK